MTNKKLVVRGRKSMYGKPMGQIAVGLDADRRIKLNMIQRHEFDRKKINVSIAEVIRAAIDWYIEWYQSENGIRLTEAVRGDGKRGGE